MRISDTWTLIRTAASDWREDKAPQISAALAYYTIFSIAPLLVIAITVSGFFLGERYARGEIVSEIQRYVGVAGAQVIESMISGARDRGEGLIASIVSIVFLIIGATGVFSQLQEALNTVWEAPPQTGGGIGKAIRDRLLAFLLVLGVGILLLLSAVVSTVLSAVTSYASDYAPGGTLWVYLADFLATALVSVVLFALLFKYLPDVEIAWSDVWIGSAITAVLFALGKIGMGLYLGRGSVASSYGLAGSVIVILLWTYYSAMIFLFGAELTQAYANQLGSRLKKPGAKARGRQRQRAADKRPVLPAATAVEHAGRSAMPEINDEREYLSNEAALAKTAMQTTLAELKRTAQQAANPALWTREYPWVAVGVAAAAGLVVGNRFMHVPEAATRHGRQRRRREEARARLHRQALKLELDNISRNGAETPSRFMTMMKRSILRLVKTAIRSTVVAAVSAGTGAAAAQGAEDEQQQDAAVV